MELRKQSWHFTMHRLVFGDDAKEPTNLCPYFWKSIFFGFFIILVFLPLAIPMMIFREIFKLVSEDDDFPSPLENGLWSEYSAMTIFLNIILLMIYSMFAMWFITVPLDKDKNLDFGWEHILGFFGWIILICTGGYYLYKYIKEKRELKRYQKRQGEDWNGRENEPNVFWEVIRAWYKRNCPVIKWK